MDRDCLHSPRRIAIVERRVDLPRRTLERFAESRLVDRVLAHFYVFAYAAKQLLIYVSPSKRDTSTTGRVTERTTPATRALLSHA